MKIEIQEVYQRKPTVYSVHAYFVDWEMDVRNIYAKKSKDSWIVLLPSCPYTDPETKKKGRFPIIEFTNIETRKKLINEIKKELIKFFKEKENNE